MLIHLFESIRKGGTVLTPCGGNPTMSGKTVFKKATDVIFNFVGRPSPLSYRDRVEKR